MGYALAMQVLAGEAVSETPAVSVFDNRVLLSWSGRVRVRMTRDEALDLLKQLNGALQAVN